MGMDPTPRVTGARAPVAPMITREKGKIDRIRAERVGVDIPPRRIQSATVEPSQAFLPAQQVFNRPRMLANAQRTRFAAQSGIRKWTPPKQHQASKGPTSNDQQISDRLATTLRRALKQAA